MGQGSKAEPLYIRALEILRSILGQYHADIALTLNDMAVLYFSLRNFGKAEDTYLLAIDNYTHVFGPKHPETLKACRNLISLYEKIGKSDKASDLLNKIK